MTFPEFRDLYAIGLPRDVVNIVRDYCCYNVWRDKIRALNREYHETWRLVDKDVLSNRKKSFLLNNRESNYPYMNVISFARLTTYMARLPLNYF